MIIWNCSDNSHLENSALFLLLRHSIIPTINLPIFYIVANFSDSDVGTNHTQSLYYTIEDHTSQLTSN